MHGTRVCGIVKQTQNKNKQKTQAYLEENLTVGLHEHQQKIECNHRSFHLAQQKRFLFGYRFVSQNNATICTQTQMLTALTFMIIGF